MNTNTIDSDDARAGRSAGETQAPARNTKPAKKPGAAKKPAGKPKADRANKKTEAITLMNETRQTRDAAEVMAATDWKAHTVRAVVSMLPSKVGEQACLRRTKLATAFIVSPSRPACRTPYAPSDVCT